ncbi:hypothetical protein ACEWY4_005469 [Coilia grayii]|uniref:Cochlin n=1 Tax=Coilia grayii TaxID=363190 RepID=A0ABD1KIQ4_9TELE
MPITCTTRGADLTEARQIVLCPADCAQHRASVFGTGIYASVSSVCTAATHRGVIGTSGGSLMVHKQQGRNNYISSYSHGVQSQSLARWTASFAVTKWVSPPLEVSSQTSTATPVKPGSVKKAVVKKPPKKQPTSQGNRDCQVDLAVLLDGSSNIGRRRFILQKNFISKLAMLLRVGENGPHLGVVQAGDMPRTEFFLTNYTQPKEVLFGLKEISFMGGNTNTGKAIMHTVETFFSSELGVRRGHPRVIMALVDGWPSDSLEEASVLARDSGVNVFMVTVAKPSPEETNMVSDPDFMKRVVCKDNGFFTLSMPSWFSTTKFIKPLGQKLCSIDQMLCSRTCYNSVNIAFLIDGSSSVGESNFRLMLDFIASVAGSYELSDVGTRIGAIQFTYDQRLEFDFGQYPNKEQTLRAIRGIPYMSGGTATGDAINYAVRNLFTNRRPGGRARNFLIVVTDGQSYDDVVMPARNAHKEGITIFSVGVAWAPMDDLRSMATEPKDAHTFFTREFSGLEQFQQPLVKAICRDFTEAI